MQSKLKQPVKAFKTCGNNLKHQIKYKEQFLNIII